MKSFITTLVVASTFLSPALAQSSSDPLQEYTISADNITAKYIGYGARLTSMIVKDRDGADTEVAVGYDDPARYIQDTETNHTYFGPIVGRYANRIRNSTFTLNGQTYDITANDHGGLDTLHGGIVGYDARNWTVVAHNDSSISFALLDTGFEGFPGTVYTLATYEVGIFPSGPTGEARPRLTTTIVSSALDTETPIMLSTHVYWNLNSFKQKTVLNDTTLWMPYAYRYIETDGNLIPNGTIGTVASRDALNFLSPKTVGAAVDVAEGVCGTGCTGVDNAFILDRPTGSGDTTVVPGVSMWSSTTGIKMDMQTNQQGVQIYTCNGQNGTIPVRQSVQNANQGNDASAQYVEQYGCVVIEPQAWIDGVNHPEWGVNKYELFAPNTQPLVFHATYDFSTF